MLPETERKAAVNPDLMKIFTGTSDVECRQPVCQYMSNVNSTLTGVHFSSPRNRSEFHITSNFEIEEKSLNVRCLIQMIVSFKYDV